MPGGGASGRVFIVIEGDSSGGSSASVGIADIGRWWWVEDPLAPMVVYVAFHLTLVHLSQGVFQLRFSTNEIRTPIAPENGNRTAKCKESSQGADEGTSIHGLQ